MKVNIYPAEMHRLANAWFEILTALDVARCTDVAQGRVRATLL